MERKWTMKAVYTEKTRQDRWQSRNLRVVSVKLTNNQYERLETAAYIRGKRPYTLVKELVENFLMEEEALNQRMKRAEPLPEQDRIIDV